MDWWPQSAEYRVGTCRRNSMQRNTPKHSWRRAALLPPLGNAALTMELQTRSFPCFVNVTFPFLPLPLCPERGTLRKGLSLLLQQHRGEPAWPRASTLSALPAHRLCTPGEGAKGEWAQLGRPKGAAVSIVPSGTAAGIVRGTGTGVKETGT